MFKKPDKPDFQDPEADTPRNVNPVREISSREQAVIGASIKIKGDLSGEEDLVIQGRIEGTITLPNNNVLVGRNGHLQADVKAKGVIVEGQVEGNLYGDEQVVIRQTGVVHGNIVAQRVALQDGCRFKGSIDMESKAARPQAVPKPAVHQEIGGPAQELSAKSGSSKEQDLNKPKPVTARP